ncbi:MAG: glutamate-5-semialdehyde dehydrogenase, partial [Lachnospiraceae bacterium]|nr:glutamate-5-semialdehyde dehydrogenase [Lachnospiraceae bacterium]
MLESMGQKAKAAYRELALVSRDVIDEALLKAASALIDNAGSILAANDEDVKAAREKNMKESLVDRLMLNMSRIEGMADGLRQVAGLESPVGTITESYVRPNGLEICKKTVPIGVIGIIYESRPNVTADAFGLCFKTQNAVILKGGSDAIRSNTAIVNVIRDALAACGITKDALQLIESTDRETTVQFMKLDRYVDVLIPRGSAGLISTVVHNSTIPVIETGTGNCHIFVDKTADLEMAVPIIINAKTQRTGVCNACESLVVHKDIAEKALPLICAALKDYNVEIRGDETTCALVPYAIPATEEDYGTEYLDLIISSKVVGSVEEAIAHINKYNTGHSEAIITSD